MRVVENGIGVPPPSEVAVGDLTPASGAHDATGIPVGASGSGLVRSPIRATHTGIPGALRRPGMGAYAEVGCGSVCPDAPPGLRLAITDLEVSFGERRVVDLAELAIGEAEIVGL